MNKLIFLLLTTLLLSNLVAAQINPLYLAQQIDLEIESKAQFDISVESDFKIDYVKANVSFYPKEGSFLKLNKLTTSPDAKFTDNIYFNWNTPVIGTNQYTVTADITSFYNHKEITTKIPFPIRRLDSNLNSYLDFTEIIDNDKDITQLASSLASGEDDLFVVVNKLAIWVKDNIEYSLDSTTESASQKSSWVLENRKGVCDELTALYISMLRSLGIPAKFISGIAYTDSDLFDYNWGPHGWAEVYFPEYGWVGIDPTYGEFGFVDATHIKMQESADAQTSNVKYEWKGRGFTVNTNPLDFEVNLKSKQDEIYSNVLIDAKYQKKSIGPNSYNLIIATIKNTDSFYKALNIYLSKTQGLETFQDYQTVILEPFELKTTYWIVKLENDMDENYIYTYPSLLYTNTGEESEIEFKSTTKDPTYSKEELEIYITKQDKTTTQVHNITIDCNKNKEYHYVNETIEMSCTLKNNGNIYYKDITLCTDKCSQISIPINQEYKFTTSTTKEAAKSYDMTITLENNDLYKAYSIPFEVINYPNIILENLSYPATTDYGKPFTIVASLILNNKPQNANITISNSFYSQTWNVKSQNQLQKTNIELTGTELDVTNNFLFTISYQDFNGKTYTLEENFKIDLKNPSILTRIKIMIQKLNNWIISIF